MIVVLTDLRRPEHLQATLAGVQSSARSEHMVVLVDGNVAPAVPPRWRVVLDPKPVTAVSTENRWTTWRAFELTSDAREDLLLLEDDVVGCPSAARYAESFRVPSDCAMVMFYAPWGDGSFPRGLWRMHASNFSFCQAVKFTATACVDLHLARNEMVASRAGGSDECIRQVGERRDWLVGVHYPGLYQHVGTTSLVSGDRSLRGDRASRAWLADGDAMSLLPIPGRGRDFYR